MQIWFVADRAKKYQIKTIKLNDFERLKCKSLKNVQLITEVNELEEAYAN